MGTIWISIILKYTQIILTKVKNLSKKLLNNETISEHKNNHKQLWRFINSIISAKILRNNTFRSLKLVDENDVFKDPSKIPKKFNKYYAEIELQISNTALTMPLILRHI